MPSHLDRALLPAAHGPPPLAGQYSESRGPASLSERVHGRAHCAGAGPVASSLAIQVAALSSGSRSSGGALSAATWGPPGDGARRRRWPRRASDSERLVGPPAARAAVRTRSDRDHPPPSHGRPLAASDLHSIAVIVFLSSRLQAYRRRQPRGTAPQGRCQARCSRASRRWRRRRSAHQREAAAGRR